MLTRLSSVLYLSCLAMGLTGVVPALAAPPPPQAAAGTPLRRWSLAGDAALAEQLLARGFDVAGLRDGQLDLIGDVHDLRALQALGLQPQEVARGRPLGSQDATAADTLGYPDLASVEASLAALVDAYPQHAELVDLGASFGPGPTAGGRQLLALRLGPAAGAVQDVPATLLVAGHHAREVLTPLIALATARRLLEQQALDPDSALLGQHAFWIVPVANPDGYAYVFEHDDLWRKNRRPLPGGAVGVDLNRNYPTGWDAGCGGSSQPGSNTYQGPAPASEVEVASLIALADALHFARVVDLHSYGRQARHGYGCWTHPQDAYLAAEAAALSAACGYDSTASSCCLGGEIHYQMSRHGSLALLLETALEFQPPFAEAQLEAESVSAGLLAHWARPLPLGGHVRDACSGLPLQAAVEVADLQFAHGEQLGSGGPFARYHAFLPPGLHSLRFSAPGYFDRQLSVVLPAQGGLELDVALQPLVPQGCWVDLGGAVSGSHGTPRLAALGALLPGESTRLQLSAAPPLAPCLVWLSLHSLPQPFAGGLLSAYPPSHHVLATTDATGCLELLGTWPAALPHGTSCTLQCLQPDAGVPVGITLSNALRAQSP